MMHEDWQGNLEHYREIRERVVTIARQHPDWSPQRIEDEFPRERGMTVSVALIAQILTETGR